MTDTNWSSEEIAKEFNGCSTLKDVIARLEGLAASRGEVICEIRVNGQLLEEADELKLAQDPTAEIRALSIRCDRPESLIGQALHSTIGFIPLLSQASVETASKFRDGEIHRGAEQLEEALEGCQWFVETILHARGAASGIGQPVAQAERWHEAEKMLHKVVAELSSTFGRKDYVVTADLLEYELSAALEMWEPVLRAEAARRPS